MMVVRCLALVAALAMVAVAQVPYTSDMVPMTGTVGEEEVPFTPPMVDGVAPVVTNRIVKGVAVNNIDVLPYSLSLLGRRDGKFFFYCSAVLIAKDVVVCAAHCVEEQNVDYFACGGLESLGKLGDKGGCSEAMDVKVPAQYDKFYLGYDIAVLRTKSDMRSTGARVARVDLNAKFPKFASGPSSGIRGYTVGFGSTKYNGSFEGNLNEGRALVFEEFFTSPLFPQEFYVAAWNNFDGTGRVICDGDSGGGLIIRRRGQRLKLRKHVVTGVASFVFQTSNGNCDSSRPSMYTAFAHPEHKQFIEDCMAEFGRRVKPPKKKKAHVETGTNGEEVNDDSSGASEGDAGDADASVE